MAANQGTTYTYNSVDDDNSSVNGTFTWTTPNPPTPGSLGGTYTLTDGTALTMTSISVNGNSVSFTVTTGGLDFAFSGNFNSGNNNFVGRVNQSLAADPDNWTASAQ